MNWLAPVGIVGGAVIATAVASSGTSVPSEAIPASLTETRTVTPKNVSDVDVKPIAKPDPKPEPTVSSCHPSYSGCLKKNSGDYDCSGGSGNGPNYTGPVQVYSSDPFDLDRDNDGWGCE